MLHLITSFYVQVLSILIISVFAIKWWFQREARLKRQNLQIKWNTAYGKDVVVLHQFPRARFCPSPSPYPLKLETFLRLHKISYVNDFEEPMSDKSKSPWITINGVNIADSQLIIEYLTDHFKLEVNPGLDQHALAVSRAFRLLIEQDLYWVLAHDRWVTNRASYVSQYFAPMFPTMPSWVEDFMLTNVFYKMVRDQTYAQGMGRHSEKEIEKMGFDDLDSLSTFLDTKAYMFGDQPTELDCVVFGFTSMFTSCCPKDNVFARKFMEKQNLIDHHERIKDKYWTDWNDCLYKPT